eukprot:scaffold2334_cov118-Cylindrotheca_fusiformis.AAC.7
MVIAGTMRCKLVSGPSHKTERSGSGDPVSCSAAKTLRTTQTKLKYPVTTAWDSEYHLTPFHSLVSSLIAPIARTE